MDTTGGASELFLVGGNGLGFLKRGVKIIVNFCTELVVRSKIFFILSLPLHRAFLRVF